jgi:hypothetical protein
MTRGEVGLDNWQVNFVSDRVKTEVLVPLLRPTGYRKLLTSHPLATHNATRNVTFNARLLYYTP